MLTPTNTVGRTIKATTITVGNFKGGVGKTKMVTMLAYDNAVLQKKKTLVIDLDPQANASQGLAKTGNISKIKKTITDAVIPRNGKKLTPITDVIVPIIDNLDLIACDTSFRDFNKVITNYFNEETEQVNYLNNLISPLKGLYDSIFIDVPPTISEFSDNAMAASDYSVIAFQTQEESLDGVDKYVGYQNFMVDKFNINLQVIAIVACMVEPDDNLDKQILSEAKEKYGDAVAETIITHQKRLKKYSREGIHLDTYSNGNYDQWDFKAHNGFNEVLNEINDRIAYLNK